MSFSTENLISRLTFAAQELVAGHPPQFHHANKRILYDYVSPAGCQHEGRLLFTRWRAAELPGTFRAVDCRTVLEAREGFYGYEPAPSGASTVEWYVNFAHQDLFGSYGLGVFAQDEIQVAEHPALASLREALPHAGARPLTVQRGIPTPVLVMGVERRCAIDTGIDADAGRPQGLYGRQFELASADTILRSTTLLDPPTITNLIAMEAPTYGRGVYTEAQIDYILTTAYTGFAAARNESSQKKTPQPEVVIHTGFWGCGAYGGNRILMALLQLLAAHLSGVDRLVFHSPDRAGMEALEAAQQALERDLIRADEEEGRIARLWRSLSGRRARIPSLTNHALITSEIVSRIQAKEFQWGTSDGN